jgi:hypothetical protein
MYAYLYNIYAYLFLIDTTMWHDAFPLSKIFMLSGANMHEERNMLL